MAEKPCSEIDTLLRSGRMADAWELAKDTGIPLGQWAQGRERRTAAKLASSLGANRLSHALDWLNWRGERDQPEYFLQCLFSRLRFTPEIKLLPEVEAFLATNRTIPPKDRANLLAFQAYMLACFRDFGPASGLIAKALELAPEESWIHVEHSVILEIEDRYDEALEAAERAVALRPYYRAAVLHKTEILVHLGHDEEAISILEEADRKTQNAAFAGRLQSFFSEKEDHESALFYLDRFEQRSPLADVGLKKWIASRRADFLLMAEDIDGFLEWAGKAGSGYHGKVAGNLAQPGARQKSRVRLKVPFIRQHNMTCAPATLAAVSRFWGKEHDHLAIADAICHDGTPWHKERGWAEENGFIAREFRVTAESARELIDRGIPFTLTTQAATSAHLQACIGYDERAGVLILRDPTNRHFGEILVEGLIENHPVAGPRGMVMVPQEEARKLDGIFLPDEAAYAAYHELLVALDTNDRMKVEAARVLLRTVAPDHPLVLEGEQRAASWRNDWAGYLSLIEAALERFPKHQSSQLRKVGALRRLGRWQDLRRFLEDLVSKKETDPVFASELGELLMEDARHLASAERYLWKAMRRTRRESSVFESMGRCMTIQKKHAEAARFRRVSASLADHFEPYSRGYFDACRALRLSEEGLDFLRGRVSRSGRKSAGPWLTLAEALHALQRHDEASEVLGEAMETRPDDGELALKAGEMMVCWGGVHSVTGDRWLESSRGRVPESDWLFAKARTASFLGDRKTAIRCWHGILREHPQSTPAWRGLVRSVAEDEGEAAAIRLLDEATGKFPGDGSLWTLKAEWLVDTERGPLEALDRVLELDPEDNWAIRERALRRMQAGDHGGAEADARHAVLLNPWAAPAHGILGEILRDRGKTEESAECFREAIRLDVDFTNPSRSLLGICAKVSEKLVAVDFIESEMRRQVSTGEIVMTYQSLAWSLIDPAELLSRLREFCSERPDLWQTWAARINQALDMRLDDEALLAAEELTVRFPLLPRGWLELGRVHRAAGRHEEEEKAVARAGEISPGWDQAARSHATVLEQLGRHDDAIRVLRRACTLDPLNGPNYGELADTLRRTGHHEEAFAALFESMEFAPFYGWAWTAACSWAFRDGKPKTVAEKLREAEKKHGHHIRWQRIAADAWDCLGETDEALASIRRGLELVPKDASLRDSLAYQFVERNEFETALEACAAVGDEKAAPVNLRGRRAWILMRSGQPLKGVAEMKALLEEEPDYAWGFHELADWHYNRGEWAELKELCTRWLRASPSESSALGYLGTAELNLKNPAGAKSAFARAHAIDPENLRTARQLMDLQMKDGEFDAAGITFERLRHYASGPYIDCDGIELALKKGRAAEALAGAEKLLADPDADEQVFGHLAALFHDNGASAEWKEWITRRIKAGTHAAPGSLTAFLRTLQPGKMIRSARKWIKREAEGSEARIAAWDLLIDNLVARRDIETLTKFSKRHGEEFRASGRLWRNVGQAFLELNCAKAGVKWFSDWQNRSEDMDSASYLNVAALHDSSPGDERRLWNTAGEIRAEGFRRFPATGKSQALRAGHALHLALDGKLDEAESVLADYDPSQVGEYYTAVGNTALSVVAAWRGDETKARTHLTDAASFFSSYNDLGSIRTRKFGEKAVSEKIAGFEGKPARLRKKWYPGLPHISGIRGSFLNKDLEEMPWWGYAIMVIIIIRAVGALAS